MLLLVLPLLLPLLRRWLLSTLPVAMLKVVLPFVVKPSFLVVMVAAAERRKGI